MFKRLLFSLLIIVLWQNAFAQNTYPYGNFSIREFKTDEYNGTAQNWDIIQNNENFIVVANSTGILLFDGVNWERVKMDNEDDSRSLAKGNNGTVYVGGVDEFGKIGYDKHGKFTYTKISHNIKKSTQFDIWSTINACDQINFIARKKIFVVKNDSLINTIKAPESYIIEKSIKYKNNIICYLTSDSTEYSAIFDGTSFIKIENSYNFIPCGYLSVNNINYIINSRGIIKEIIKKENSYSFIDLGFKLKTETKLIIHSVAISSNKTIAVGTHDKGIYLFTKKGEFIRSFTEKEGLVNEQIQNLFFDHSNNLWSANDNGIFLIDLSNNITKFSTKDGISASVEDFYFSDKKNYVATHKDLFENKITGDKIRFEETDYFQEEIYQIKDFTFSDGKTKTMLIANQGLFVLEGDKVEFLGEIWAWDLSQSTSDPDKIWVGLDGNDGIAVLTYNKGEFEYKRLTQTHGEVRKLLEVNNKLYYAVKNDGIHILDTTKKQKDNVLPGLVDYKDSTIKYQQFTLELFQNKIYVGTDNGLYVVTDNDNLKPFNHGYNKENYKIHRLLNDNNEKLWAVIIQNSDSDSETETETPDVGYIDFNSKDFTYYSAPFTTASKELIQVIAKDKLNKMWFGGISNIYVYNPLSKFKQDSFSVYITKFSAKDSVLLNYINYSKEELKAITFDLNTVKLNFSSPSYYGLVDNTYSWYLEGLDKTWSNFSKKTEAEYPRLNEGSYTFRVRSKNFYGSISNIRSFTFTILPPWYRSWWAYIIYFLIIASLIFIITKLSIKRVKDQNVKLEKIVDERTAEVENQKHEIEEKNRDIVDSIKYAKRIQNTILPTNEKLNRILGDHFVIYKPKDIVSGDFYWADELDGKAYISAIDCTGHGVPGAFVSIVGFNGLKRTVNEFRVREPGKILDKLTDIVVETFTATESHLKDGMDMSLCSINYATLEVEFAGANNPLILIRNGELLETKGNKQPIGDFDKRIEFTNHKIQLQKGDSIYLFTDGYADQFGGPKGKKFKLKTLKNLLLNIYTLPIDEQKIALEKAFNDWKGNLEQLDDVCLIGLKF